MMCQGPAPLLTAALLIAAVACEDTTQPAASSAPTCGNGIVEATESCDGAALANESCATQGFYEGELRCAADCTLDPSGCSGSCGDGLTNGSELCDGDCPTSCDDGDPCTQDLMQGAPSTCDALCSHEPALCGAADACCLPYCDSAADADCASGEPAGSGKSSYSCPAGAITILPGDDVAAAVQAAPAGATLCIEGEHQVSTPLAPKEGQRWIGVGADARLSGAIELAPWTPSSTPGVWQYTGTWAQQQPHIAQLSGSMPACYEVSTYQDDLFFADQRMMRVLSLEQLTGAAPLPAGQAVTPAELGRFFFDYANDVIYIDRDPGGARVELAVADAVISTTGASHVVLQNLLFEKARTAVVNAKDGTSWRLEDCTVRFAHNYGVTTGSGSAEEPFLYRRVLATNNGQYGMINFTIQTRWATLDGCELSWNNIANYRSVNATNTGCGDYWNAGGAKFTRSEGAPGQPALRIAGLDSHHNVGDGFWTDFHNRHVLVTGSTFHDNEGYGYFHEISCEIELLDNVFYRNGVDIKNARFRGGGIRISVANDATVRGNLLYDNAVPIQLVWHPHPAMSNFACLGAADDTDVSNALRGNVIADNDVYMCYGSAGAKNTTAYTSESLAERGNIFADNRYYVPDPSAASWTDLSSSQPLGWSAWQAAGQDLDGSVVSPCSYP